MAYYPDRSRITAATRQLQDLDTRLAEARELERHLANWLDACAQMPVPDRLAQLNDLQTTAASESAAQQARDAAESHNATLHKAEQACAIPDDTSNASSLCLLRRISRDSQVGTFAPVGGRQGNPKSSPCPNAD